MEDNGKRGMLTKFFSLLEDINQLDAEEEYKAIKEKIPLLAEYIERLVIQDSEKRLIELDINRDFVDELKQNIHKFYNDFFEPFNIYEIFKYLFKKNSQMYRKRIYQLNHFFGIVQSKWTKMHLDKNIILKLNVFSMLYLDYYESFALFLRPFMVKLLTERRKVKITFFLSSNDLYKFLFPFYFQRK
ncbi:MAG: hypothetical protein ACTSQ8_23115 [Candidatus Helarchaeota archaeon]